MRNWTLLHWTVALSLLVALVVGGLFASGRLGVRIDYPAAETAR